jgi:dolichol-phosphate mannosyltransferase
MYFSIVIPVYKCSRSIEELGQRLVNLLNKLEKSYEIIFIDDNSPENDWEIISTLSKKHKEIRGIQLSRNFGQHMAITAGLENVTGEWIVVMDGDLQDQPEEILNLYDKSQEGYDIVSARRAIRQDKWSKKATSKFFYLLFGYLTDTKYDSTVANFGIYHKSVIHSILLMKDKVRVFPILLQWVGFKRTSIDVEHQLRSNGKSAYTYLKLFQLASNIIISFSNKPLNIMTKVGGVISITSLLIGVYYLLQYFLGVTLVSGYTSLIISIWFLSGIILSSLGIIGIYIGRIFDSSKDRPHYLIRSTVGK